MRNMLWCDEMTKSKSLASTPRKRRCLGFNSHGQNIFPRIFPIIFPKVQFDFFIVTFWCEVFSGRFPGRFSGRYFGHVNWTPGSCLRCRNYPNFVGPSSSAFLLFTLLKYLLTFAPRAPDSWSGGESGCAVREARRRWGWLVTGSLSSTWVRVESA